MSNDNNKDETENRDVRQSASSVLLAESYSRIMSELDKRAEEIKNNGDTIYNEMIPLILTILANVLHEERLKLLDS